MAVRSCGMHKQKSRTLLLADSGQSIPLLNFRPGCTAKPLMLSNSGIYMVGLYKKKLLFSMTLSLTSNNAERAPHVYLA